MKFKHFFVRLIKDGIQADEDALNEFMANIVVKKTVNQFIATPQMNYWSILVFYEDVIAEKPKPEPKNKPEIEQFSKRQFDVSDLDRKELERYEALRKWRVAAAHQEAMPGYVIASNIQLSTIGKLNPSKTEDMLTVKGFGEKRINKYGEDIIALLNAVS